METKLDRREFLKASALAGVAGRMSVDLFASTKPEQDSAAWIRSLIVERVANSSSNSIRNTENEKAWDEPLVGFARGDDPIFESFKEHVGPFHLTPLEIFGREFPNVAAKAGELAVISWVLPHTEAIKADLRRQKTEPSEKWIRARIYGEEFNEGLRRFVAETLTEAGHPAVVPVLTGSYKMEQSQRYGIASTWSERHAAYAGGLGTFGLCDGLITAKGKAMRCGSVVAKIEVPATPRPYKDHHAYCLFYATGGCGVCVTRCPAGAVTKAGHDKMACLKQCNATAEYAAKHYGLDGYGCGFCQTGVPCESKIPV